MNLRLFALITITVVFSNCSNDAETLPMEPVVQAYDTLEFRYQQMGDLAMDLITNVSVDADIFDNQVPDLLERQPVVSLDFRKPLTTRKDIVSFVNYQKKIDGGIQKIFAQLDGAQKWRSAPIVLEFRSRYDSLKASISAATLNFNSAVKKTNLNLMIPSDPITAKASQ